MSWSQKEALSRDLLVRCHQDGEGNKSITEQTEMDYAVMWHDEGSFIKIALLNTPPLTLTLKHGMVFGDEQELRLSCNTMMKHLPGTTISESEL